MKIFFILHLLHRNGYNSDHLTRFLEGDEYYIETIDKGFNNSYYILLDTFENKLEKMSDVEIKEYLSSVINKKLAANGIDKTNIYLPPFSKSKFEVRIKLFIGNLKVKQTEIDDFSNERLDSGEKRYAKLIRDVFYDYKVYDIDYQNSYVYFKLKTKLTNTDITTPEDIVKFIFESSFEDGIYGGGEFVFKTEESESGGYYEYNLDFRKKENIEIEIV